MNVPTRDLLEQFSFKPDWSSMTDLPPGYVYDFGSLKLSAAQVSSRSLTPIFSFGGVLNDGRCLRQIRFEMPLEVESVEQGAAWIADGLGSSFTPSKPSQWLEEGRAQRHLLPWVRERIALEARPKCVVERGWFRVAGRQLRQLAASAQPSDLAVLSFDNGVLTIRSGSTTLAMPAAGPPWNRVFTVSLAYFRALPKRIMTESVPISAWQERINIGRLCLPLSNLDSGAEPS